MEFYRIPYVHIVYNLLLVHKWFCLCMCVYICEWMCICVLCMHITYNGLYWIKWLILGYNWSCWLNSSSWVLLNHIMLYLFMLYYERVNVGLHLIILTPCYIWLCWVTTGHIRWIRSYGVYYTRSWCVTMNRIYHIWLQLITLG